MGTGLPQPQVFEYLLDCGILLDKGDDLHGGLAFGTDQRVYFIYFSDQSFFASLNASTAFRRPRFLLLCKRLINRIFPAFS